MRKLLTYQGAGVPLDPKGSEEGEKDARLDWHVSPHGTQGTLLEKRMTRDPFNFGVPYGVDHLPDTWTGDRGLYW